MLFTRTYSNLLTYLICNLNLSNRFQIALSLSFSLIPVIDRDSLWLAIENLSKKKKKKNAKFHARSFPTAQKHTWLYTRSGFVRKLVYAVIYRSIYALYLQLDRRWMDGELAGNPGATSAACCLFVKFNWRLGQASAFYFPPFVLGVHPIYIHMPSLAISSHSIRSPRIRSRSQSALQIQIRVSALKGKVRFECDGILRLYLYFLLVII